MSQHSWYDKTRRHYGRKPNTRRARGLKRRDFGKHHKPIMADVLLPERTRPETMAEYFKIYNIYCRAYEKYMSEEVAMYKTLWYCPLAKHSEVRVNNAIRKVEAFKELNGL